MGVSLGVGVGVGVPRANAVTVAMPLTIVATARAWSSWHSGEPGKNGGLWQVHSASRPHSGPSVGVGRLSA